MIRSLPTAQNTSVLNDAFLAGGQRSFVDGAQHVAVGGKSYSVGRAVKHNLAG